MLARSGLLSRRKAAATLAAAAAMLVAGGAARAAQMGAAQMGAETGLGEARATPERNRGTPGKIVIEVDKSTQRMTVYVDGEKRMSLRVSTGRAGYATPNGSFRALLLREMHYSRKYDNAPMPHSIFFTGAGHAIHATNAIGRLGRPASHGCIRLAPKDAKALFELVERHGLRNTSIRIVGTDPKPVRGRARA